MRGYNRETRLRIYTPQVTVSYANNVATNVILDNPRSFATNRSLKMMQEN